MRCIEAAHLCSARTLVLVVVMTACALLNCMQALAAQPGDGAGSSAADESSLRLRIRPLPDGVAHVRLVTDSEGLRWFELETVDGEMIRLRPDEFAARMERDHSKRRTVFRALNITSVAGIAWVAIGLLGQLLFTGRMILQWLVSERSKRSIVPVGFWWMSLAGASMLMAYFIWRRDIVGVLGQSAGWVIYVRNLWLIYRQG